MSLSRRGFVQTAVAVGVLAEPAVGRAAQAIAAPAGGWPSTKIGNVKALKTNEPVSFSYPDASSLAWLIKLGHPAYEGGGPDQDIVAFSGLCTHMGCPVEFVGERFVCPCHKSMFDPAKNGQIYQGLASDYLPQVKLRIDAAGDIHAIAMSGLVWGRSRDIMSTAG